MNFQDNQEVDALVENLGILNKQPGVSTVCRLCGEEKALQNKGPSSCGVLRKEISHFISLTKQNLGYGSS